jgi:CubicO group peptidase (beta-lactamase class C family)
MSIFLPIAHCKSASKQFVVYLALCLSLAAMSDVTSARSVATPNVDTSAIDQLVAKEMAARNVPGLALAITYRGELVYAKGYGVANLEHSIPVTTDTVFALASVSKPIIALAVARLIEQKRLSWTDLISKHLPGTPDTWRGITLAHLVNHTSGIVRESPAFDGNTAKADFELISATYSVPLAFPTGTKMQYCNLCYFALAETITRVTGEPWPQWVKRELFDATSMRDSRTTSVQELVPRRASSYEWKDGRYMNMREYVALRPSGAFLSTVNDVARLEAALFAGNIVSKAALDLMYQPTKLNDGQPGRMGNGPFDYGMGWDVGTVDGTYRVGHGGSLAGFRTMYARYPDSGWAIVLLANSTSARPFSLERSIAKLLPMN